MVDVAGLVVPPLAPGRCDVSTDVEARVLWRQWRAEPTPDNAQLWAQVEARMRCEVPDPPVAEKLLIQVKAPLNALAGGATTRLALLLLELRSPGEPLVLEELAQLRVVDLADADPTRLEGLQGAGVATMFAAALLLRAFEVHRLLWETWIVANRRVHPRSYERTLARTIDLRNRGLIRAACAP